MNLSVRAALAAIFLCPVISLAGDLNPPAGPVQPTMKSLDAIEPRVCLNDLPGDEGAAVLITEPGSYFLREDVRGQPGQHGIRIVTSGDVSIDLNGFSVLGAPNSLDGINMESPPGAAPSSLSVRCASGECSSSVSGWGRDGIRTDNVLVCQCTHLLFEDNGGHGVNHLHAEQVIHRDIAARNNLGDGIRVRDAATGLPTGKRQHSFVRCESSGNAGDGFSLRDAATGLPTGKRQHRAISCVATNNGGHGFRQEYGQQTGSVHDHCVSSGNGGDGFHFVCPIDSFEVEMEGSTSSGNNGFGVAVAVSSGGSTARAGNDRGVCAFGRCFVANNGLAGVFVDLPNSNVTAISADELRCVGNGGDGFQIVGAAGVRHHGHVTVLKRCEMVSNGGNGASSNNPLHVENSNLSENALFGASVSGPDPNELMMRCVENLYFRNGAGGVRCDHGRFSGGLSVFSDNTGSGITCNEGCVILDRCDVTRNTLCGVEVNDGTLNMTACTLRRNDEAGCKKRRGSCIMTDTTCELNGMGAIFEDCTNVTMVRCVFNDNVGVGVQNRSTVGPVRWMAPESIANNNGGNGFDIQDVDGGSFEACVASGNMGGGFVFGQGADRCRIERCVASANTGAGFSVLGIGNLIIGNRATASPVGSFNIGEFNIAGPLVRGTQVANNTNCNANIEY